MRELPSPAPLVFMPLKARHAARLKRMREEGLFEGLHLGVILSAVAVLTWLSVRVWGD